MATEPPPSFVSDTKSYAEYKADLEMWSRITSLDKKVQAEMVVYRPGYETGTSSLNLSTGFTFWV